MLIEYFPILLFILIGIGFGFVPMIAGKLVGPNLPGRREALPLRMRLRGVRRRAHEVRRALLPRGHPFHPVRPGNRVPLPLGRGVLRHRAMFGFLAGVVFLGILTVGFAYEWKKGALDWE
jgi:NADH-quinone oxidoreductase subunit A